jgi:hypothetical protein
MAARLGASMQTSVVSTFSDGNFAAVFFLLMV